MSAGVVDARAPAARAVRRAGATEGEAPRQRWPQQWATRLERAGAEVDRAARHDHAGAPENRLGARPLERHWEEACAREAPRKADPRRLLASHPATRSASAREAMRRLARDLPALGPAETTPAADRQAMLRPLGERGVVTGQGEREHVALEGPWIGGHRPQTRRRRPVARVEQ
jgi:hypothetical protein